MGEGPPGRLERRPNSYARNDMGEGLRLFNTPPRQSNAYG